MGKNKALVVSMYAKETHCTVGISILKCSAIFGIAMFVPERCKTANPTPIAIVKYANQV